MAFITIRDRKYNLKLPEHSGLIVFSLPLSPLTSGGDGASLQSE